MQDAASYPAVPTIQFIKYNTTRAALALRVPIAIPPDAEQEAIATALSDADAWIESLEQLIAKAGGSQPSRPSSPLSLPAPGPADAAARRGDD